MLFAEIIYFFRSLLEPVKTFRGGNTLLLPVDLHDLGLAVRINRLLFNPTTMARKSVIALIKRIKSGIHFYVLDFSG